jgi:hypothetical protein
VQTSPSIDDDSDRPLVDRVYAALVEEEDARACRGISEAACREMPASFVANTVAQAMTSLGDAIINPKTTLPWLLSSLAAPAWSTSLLVPVREAGALLPQLAIAGWLRTLPVRKYAWMLGAALQGLAVLAMALSAMTLRGASFGTAIVLLVAVFSLARGVCSVASKDVLGKTVAKTRRGRVSGYAASAAGLGTVGIALLLWLTGNAEQMPYALLLSAGGALWLLAIPVYAAIPEYAGATEGGANGLREALRRLSLVAEDRDFRQLLIVRGLLLSTALVAPFYVVLAREEAAATLPLFLLAQGTASLVAGPVWGRFADVSSRRVLVVSGAGAAFLGIVVATLAWQSPELAGSRWFLPAAFLVLAVLHDGVRLGRKTHVVDLAGGNRRTDYVAVGNTLTGIALLLVGAIVAVVPAAAPLKIAGLSTLAGMGALAATRLADVQA